MRSMCVMEFPPSGAPHVYFSAPCTPVEERWHQGSDVASPEISGGPKCLIFLFGKTLLKAQNDYIF